MKNVLRITTTFTLIMFFTITLATAQTPQDIAKDARVSTVNLMMDNNSYGSGFFVTPEHIATSYHVIEGAKSGHVSPVLQKEKFDIVGIAAADKENDLVILQVFGIVGKPLPIGDSKTVDVMDKVIVVGNPAGIDGTVTTDVISNILGDKYFLMSAPISPGSSGGAVLNERGEVIGITTGSILEKNEKKKNLNRNQNLNLAVPSNYLTPLVEKAKKPVVLKPLSTDGVTGYRLTWGDGSYDFSLRNQRREDIQVVRCIVIFYGKNDEPICIDIFEPPMLVLHAGGAKRIRRHSLTIFLNSNVGPELSERMLDSLEDRWLPFNPSSIKSLVKRYEVRILDLNINRNYSASKNYKSLKGVTGGKFTWSEKPDARDNTSYVFSLHNSLDKAVERVSGLIIFYDDKRVPIHSRPFSTRFKGDVKILAGKTVTISEDVVHDSIRQLTKRVDIKILEFETVE